LTLASCQIPETTTSEGVPEAGGAEITAADEAKPADAGASETTKVESKEPDVEPSEVLISLGDKKLTMRQLQWMQPNLTDRHISRLTKWWLENELLYAEAQRRGITKDPRARFITEQRRRYAFQTELAINLRESIEITDDLLLAHYEENKESDSRLRQRGYLRFSHVRTRTLEEAQAVLKRIEGGEDIEAIAKEVSIHDDAKRGGVKKSMYRAVEKRFGSEFFEALSAAKIGEVIGPISVEEGAYEVARLKDKTEPKPFPFEQVKDRIRGVVRQKEANNAFKALLERLKKEAADKIVKSPHLIEVEKAEAAKGPGGARPADRAGRIVSPRD